MKELSAALVAAQLAIPPMQSDGKAKVSGVSKQGKPFEYTYDYLTLPHLLAVVLPVLNENGLALSQIPSYDEMSGWHVLISKLIHTSGEWVEGKTPIQAERQATPQDWGKAVTYARRYAITALLGIAAEDDDAAGVGKPKTSPATGKKGAGERKAAADAANRPAPTNDDAPSPKLLEQIDQAVDEYASFLEVDRSKIIEKIGSTPMTEQWRTSGFSAELALKRLQDNLENAKAAA